ncbi:50S ribosomal protein L1 [Candidatus Bathyarchaeota archaeon]|nr:50S ribosomal protein L1 [Candidatus Bathyarchaeota archaeon]TET63517.1 MAG: 50S ribosomal protein L1 [Candidatus Bathyarchaeota archaeon]
MPLDKKTIVTAIKEVKEKSTKRNFTQSVELILNLKDIDMKSPEGRIQERIELPHQSPEKPNKICVIATGELALKAKKAKADLVIGQKELGGLAGKKKDLRKIANEYNFFIVEAPLMPRVGKVLGPALGPRGKMPVPVPPSADISGLLKRYRKMVFVRMRNHPVIRCRIGVESMKEEEIAENVQAVLTVIEGKLKRGAKNIKTVYIKTSMGTPVKIT